MEIKNKPSLVLSSSSSARKALLDQIKLSYTSFSPLVNEKPLKGEKPKELVKRLSIIKANEAKKKFEESFIFAADTVVFARKKYINKTENKDIAYSNIKMLSGRRHTVFTGLTSITPNGKMSYYLTITKIKFKLLSEKEIFDYLKLDEWKNKAGSYAIQGFAASFIDFISGSYTSAVGLPLEKLYTILSNNGLI